MSDRAAGPLATGATVARNTVWNLAGFILPGVAALVAIPVLVERLGEARFGVLSLVWVVNMLFSLADLGVVRATTNLLARDWSRQSRMRLAQLGWGSLGLLGILGVGACAIFIALIPWVVNSVLEIPADLRTEAARSFVILALSLPIVLASGPTRAILEATQSFGRLNLIRIPTSIVNFLGPMVLVLLVPRVDLAIGAVAVGRLIALVAYGFHAHRVAPDLLRPVKPPAAVVGEILRVGGWFGVVAVTLPAIAAIDRLVVGARLSLADVGHYSVPYEIVTRLWLLSGSLLAVLFPVFSALQEPRALARWYWGATRYLFAPTVATATALVVLSPELFVFWLGPDFGAPAAAVCRWLSLGIVASVVGQVPSTLMMSTGRGVIPGVVQLIELPLYGAAAWWLAGRIGVVGVAMAWSVRAAVEAGVLFVGAGLVNPAARTGSDAGRVSAMPLAAVAVLLPAWWLGMPGVASLPVKSAALILLLASFGGWSWLRLLSPDERSGARRLLQRRSLSLTRDLPSEWKAPSPAPSSPAPTPRVSVVIPAYNHARFLPRAIESVLAQDYPDVELIVIDDGSTDDTPEVLARYADRCRVLRQSNRGQSATLNRGWELATGTLFSYLGADDLLRPPEALSRAVAALQARPDAVMAYGDFELIDIHDRPLRRVRNGSESYLRMLLDMNPVAGAGILLRRDAFERAGGWDPRLKLNPDLDYWLRLGLLGTFAHVPHVLAAWRIHPESQTAVRPSAEGAAEPLRIVRNLYEREGLPPEVAAVRSRAFAAAHAFEAQQHLRARRWSAAVRSMAALTRRHLPSLFRMRVLRMIAHGLLGPRHASRLPGPEGDAS